MTTYREITTSPRLAESKELDCSNILLSSDEQNMISSCSYSAMCLAGDHEKTALECSPVLDGTG
jgi:hypothetical protein